jgi:hypothetical protein
LKKKIWFLSIFQRLAQNKLWSFPVVGWLFSSVTLDFLEEVLE